MKTLFIGATLCLALLLHPSSLNLLSSLLLLTCFLSRCYLGLTSLIYYIFMGNVCFSECFFFFSFVSLKSFFLVPVYKDVRNTSYTRTIVFPPPYLRGSRYGVHGEPCMSLSTANFGSVFCLVYKTVLKHLKLIYQHNRN